MRALALITVGLLIVGAVYVLPSKPPELLGTPEPAKSVSILFTGDMMFDRFIRTMSERIGGDFIFSCIYHVLAEADFALGNLEGPITEHESISEGSIPGSPENYRFTFPPSTAELLKRHTFEVVNIGNNHIGDFGREGMRSTRAYLDSAGVAHFGGVAGDEPVLRKDAEGVALSFISYNQFGGGSSEVVAEKIREERSAGRVPIVYTHWGEEYVPSTDAMRKSARLFAESGAALVIGSHPHIVQEHEYIGDTLVYYSLGNFIFDQHRRKDTTAGLAVLVHISEGMVRPSVTEFPVILQTDGRTCERAP